MREALPDEIGRGGGIKAQLYQVPRDLMVLRMSIGPGTPGLHPRVLGALRAGTESLVSPNKLLPGRQH